MNNLEKYRDEIINFSGNFCDDFVRPIILKSYNKTCGVLGCTQCRLLQSIWLNEEYKELEVPGIDWSKVEVDTPIQVSDNGTRWYNRYFCKYENGKVYAWKDGATSFSADGFSTSWIFARLV